MTRDVELLQFLHYHPLSSRSEIVEGMTERISESSVKRLLTDALEKGLVEVVGKGRGTKYKLTPQAHVTMPLDLDTYFAREMDEREIQTSFNFDFIRNILPNVELFTADERRQMKELSVHRIEDIHSLLVKDLNVDRNIRYRRVGITGTNYMPLDNEVQIREAMDDTCKLINGKESVFDKALLALVLLSYIQAFSDGNKRTARITSNAILIANGYCPLSFRTVDSIGYKKAMLIFYEQNNISAFKKIFIEQYLFAVRTYF